MLISQWFSGGVESIDDSIGGFGMLEDCGF